MSMALAAMLMAPPIPAPAYCREAEYLARCEHDIVSYGLGTYTFSSATRMKEAVESLRNRFCAEGWDGYGARPVKDNAVVSAIHMLDCFNPDCPEAEVGVDADGEVTFDWYKSCDNNVTAVVSGGGEIYCAWSKNAITGFATFSDRDIKRVIDLVSEVVNG